MHARARTLTQASHLQTAPPPPLTTLRPPTPSSCQPSPSASLFMPTLSRSRSSPSMLVSPVMQDGVPVAVASAQFSSPPRIGLGAASRAESPSGYPSATLQRPQIPVQNRQTRFAEFMTVADSTPQAQTYGENPSFFNLDKDGGHIHYIDATGAPARAPWKDQNLLSPVASPAGAMSPVRRSILCDTMTLSGFGRPGCTPFAKGPAVGPSFFPNGAPGTPTVRRSTPLVQGGTPTMSGHSRMVVPVGFASPAALSVGFASPSSRTGLPSANLMDRYATMQASPSHFGRTVSGPAFALPTGGSLNTGQW